MVKITHALKFETLLDESNSTALRFLSMPVKMQEEMLEGMLYTLLASKLDPILDELNKDNSWAKLTVVK
jgi:hypothetical protein